jgi:hypothetical protein
MINITKNDTTEQKCQPNKVIVENPAHYVAGRKYEPRKVIMD